MPGEPVFYTTQLQAGLGMVEETKLLLGLYQPGMNSAQLCEAALRSGQFPLVSARRLRNIVVECFGPRYLKHEVAMYLKPLAEVLPTHQLVPLLLVFTAQANRILADFIRDIYWPSYSAGRSDLNKADATDFVQNAVRDGKTRTPWSESTIRRVSGYLLGCCADFGLLSAGRSATRSIQPVRIQSTTVLFFAYHLRFAGLSDNAVLNHQLWGLFGLEPGDVRDELKRLASNGWWIIQSAAGTTRITWLLPNMEDVTRVIAAPVINQG
ncbi:BrxA family protein [Thiorhodovibrio frisius]|uniref:Putative inner membrane protein (DUF1819) n=1 Tax=Thiorhodovibrio frisius TaxID=631362 RepID=H8Z2K0_9GAMM|nr:BrxA family protein [Thiorhodovibrio frisius]EIC22693.1 Putative inner membrane protein (DUF1819) [Thiorhodovibrio frisius]WPL22449.1 hypothetical protein Thiofri_02613 [Thiorhodovibrio frisius]